MRRTPLRRYTPLRRGPWKPYELFDRRKETRRPRRRQGRSRSYLDWIRSLGCVICGRKAQAAHTGSHGLAAKASDYSAIPLCAEHHLEVFDGSYHRLGRIAFELRYGLSITAIVSSLQAMWRDR